ncbi:MAG: LysE family translocator [Pelistega sp.]|nr:LysE family translocator [Pelistega sp.]
MPLDTFLSFFSICALIAISPGPDNIFVLLQTALYGYRVGFVIVLGLMSGIIFHTLLVTLGVAALLKASATAFTLLKFIGAAYLLYLAYLTFKARPISLPNTVPSSKPTNSRLSLWQYYRRGIFMNITNPKVSLFFLAFFPQFTYSTEIPVSQQMLSLSGVFVLATFVVFNSIVIFSAYFGRILRQSPRAQLILNWITIVVFCGLALRLLLG